MSETQTLLKVRQTDYICDHCNEGLMAYTGSWWEIHPSGVRMHYHRCEICGVQVAYERTYPSTEFLPEVPQ